MALDTSFEFVPESAESVPAGAPGYPSEANGAGDPAASGEQLDGRPAGDAADARDDGRGAGSSGFEYAGVASPAAAADDTSSQAAVELRRMYPALVDDGAAETASVAAAATPAAIGTAERHTTSHAEGFVTLDGVRGGPGGSAAPVNGTSAPPSDPLFFDQWHFARIGDVSKIWNDYTGDGVKVGIYDSGVQYIHPDLNDNYDASLHIVVGGVTYDGANVGNDGHGTSVAGLIAAERNGVGGVGIAYDASITGINIFDPASAIYINAMNPSSFYAAIRAGTAFDVINNSWGSEPGFADWQNLNSAGSFAAETAAAFEYISANGRGGLGTVIVKSAGNEYINANAEGINVSRHTITVAAVGDSGFSASYSNHGTNVLVSAPGSEFAENGGLGIVTTDLLGTDGYNLRSDKAGAHDYTDDFGGTSAAGPIVAAVTTLMLDANANLGWRDVQSILALSATHTGSGIGATTPGQFENGNWLINAATNWNGGGMHFHNNYGFGMVNAYNAVRMAEAWSLFTPTPQTSANESYFEGSTVTVNQPIGDFQTGTGTWSVGSSRIIEHFEVTITLTHDWMAALDIEIVSPQGVHYMLADHTTGGGAAGGITWTFAVDALRGQILGGDWVVNVTDTDAFGDTGTFTSFSVRAYGSKFTSDVNDVYHFTDEFALMAMLDPARRLVSDTDGGTDWLNMAAMTGNLVVNLSNLAYSSVNGQQFIRIADGTVIENVVTGDGNDVIRGNAAANDLYGMRGNDSLYGGAGVDRLYGGAGNDTLDGGTEADRMEGGTGDDFYYVDNAADVVIEVAGQGTNDRVLTSVSYTLAAAAEIEVFATTDPTAKTNLALTGNDFAQTIIGNAGNNVIDGKGGIDIMSGGLGNDFYYVDNAADIVIDAAGQGTNDRVITSVSYVLAAAAEIELMATTNAAGTANLSLTGNNFAQTIIGNAGNNIIDGKGGIDNMQGGAGNDFYYVDNVGDVVVELAGNGSNDRVLTSVSYTLASNAEIEVFATTDPTGTSNLNLTGNDFAQTIIGNAGNNIIDGKGGIDNMQGGAGNDFYYVDNAADIVIEAAGNGTNDRVLTSVSYTLAAAAEIEVFATTNPAGTSNLSLTGNDFAQTIIGNAGNNIIDGKGGIDNMQGGAGNDFYYVDNVGDIVIETVGNGTNDRVLTSVSYTLASTSEIEVLATTDPTGTSNLNLTGNNFAQSVIGNAGSNILNGKGGNDILTGGAGKDFFVFDTALGATNVDKITDYSVVDDTIRLDDAIFAGIGTAGAFMNAIAFVANLAGQATTSDHRIIYDTDSGELFYDADGNGVGLRTKFGQISAGLAMASTEFAVI